jgi:hypothetical protein
MSGGAATTRRERAASFPWPPPPGRRSECLSSSALALLGTPQSGSPTSKNQPYKNSVAWGASSAAPYSRWPRTKATKNPTVVGNRGFESLLLRLSARFTLKGSLSAFPTAAPPFRTRCTVSCRGRGLDLAVPLRGAVLTSAGEAGACKKGPDKSGPFLAA